MTPLILLVIIATVTQVQGEEEDSVAPRCLNVGCSNQIKGGRCYPSAQAGMDCIKSDDLCYPLSPDEGDWHCCAKPTISDYQEEVAKCEDVGCKEHFNGHGQCYTLNSRIRPRSHCVSSNTLCKQTNALTARSMPAPTCKWTNWIDRDNPTATGDWEHLIAPPYPGLPVGPGSDCEYTEYQVRIKGSSEVYTDVSSIPGPWTIHDHDGIVCINKEQTEIDGCSGQKYQNSDKCCPDMEVKFCCQPKVVEPEPCQCCMHPYNDEPCKWTNWIDRDNPTATCDCEHLLMPGKKPVGPGTTCEYSKYEVRIKGTTQAYSDVNDLPGPWKIHDYPNGIKCKNMEQTIDGCEGIKNQNSDKCCPDMEVKYCCK